MNGMHSVRKIKAYYPQLAAHDLRYIYSAANRKQVIKTNKLQNISYDEFLVKTSLSFTILGCKYISQ